MWKYPRLVCVSRPGLDLVDHDDLLDPFEEDLLCELGPRGPGNIMLPGRKTVRFLAPEDRSKGERLVASYGALPAAAYLERYGFLTQDGCGATLRGDGGVEI